MPSTRDIPGFYYDTEKNRYFSIKSRGGPNQLKSQLIQEKPSLSEDECKSKPDVEAKVPQILWKREIGNSCTSGMFQQTYIKTKASKPWLWSYGTASADGAIEEFRADLQTNEGLKGANMIAWGNSNGIFGVCEVMHSRVSKYSDVSLEPVRIFPPTKLPMLDDVSRPPRLRSSSTSRVSHSKITAIKKQKSIKEGDKDSLILTTLGSGFEGGTLHLLKQRQVFDDSLSFDQPLPPLKSTMCVVTDCSVWTAAYSTPDRATLGTSKGAALICLETSALRWLIRSKSDVLSQECDLLGNLVFCGFRNGFISMVDLRTAPRTPRRMPSMQTGPESSSSPSSPRGQSHLSRKSAHEYVHSRKKTVPFRDKEAEVAKNFCETMRMSSAICSLKLLRSDESYLLSSAMNGDIYLWDTRLVGRGPVLTYAGNQNTCHFLGLGVDSSESLLASGGEDCTVRIWSLRSGKLLQTIPKLPAIVNDFSALDSNSSSSLKGDHAWRMWLGSSTGVMYMHG